MKRHSELETGRAGTRRCVFFDRDGVVNESPGPGYVERWSDFRLLPGFVEALRVVKESGWAAVVVTNQRGVARGIMSLEDLQDIHRRLEALLKDAYGLELTDIFYCPHGEGECECRKPMPGMLLGAARGHDLDLGGSWMVGDSVRDIAAGKAAGCGTVFVGSDEDDGGADYRIDSMDELAALLERILKE